MVVIYFYLDTRFIISIILISIILFIQILQKVTVKKSFIICISLIILGSLVANQYKLYKIIIGQNILGNTRGWQYEAVLHIGTFMQDKPDSIFVTALHPPLFSLYGYDNVALLPLAITQEFYEDRIWGEIDSNPVTEITKRLEHNTQIYTSNAYVTALPMYSESLENIKTEFNLELIQSGCLETCNIYSVKLKTK